MLPRPKKTRANAFWVSSIMMKTPPQPVSFLPSFVLSAPALHKPVPANTHMYAPSPIPLNRTRPDCPMHGVSLRKPAFPMLDLACFASFKKQNYLTLPRNSTCDAPSEPGALSHASQRPRCPPIEREKMTIEKPDASDVRENAGNP